MKQGNSELVAVNPDSLEVIDAIELPQPSSVPHTITMYDGKVAIYIGANSGAFHYWDPKSKKLSQDTSWIPSVLQEGQTKKNDHDIPELKLDNTRGSLDPDVVAKNGTKVVEIACFVGTEINFPSRYPGGIVIPKIGAGPVGATTPATVVTAIRKNGIVS